MKIIKTLLVVLLTFSIAGFGYSVYKSKTSLPSCEISSWYSPTKVNEEENTVITEYFTKAKLMPISFLDAMKANRKFMSAGWHTCTNKGSSNGGYEGFIPTNATEGFLVGVHHKTDLYGSFNYMQLARIDGQLVVVGVVTSP